MNKILIYLERLDYFEFREAKAYDRNFLTVPPEFWFPELKRRTEALSWSLKMRKMQLNTSNTNDANTVQYVFFSQNPGVVKCLDCESSCGLHCSRLPGLASLLERAQMSLQKK